MRWIRPEKRKAIYLRDGLECVYCGDSDRLTLDHICPRVKGGNNGARNLVTACLSCNSSRQDRSVREFAGEKLVRKINKLRRRSLKRYLAQVGR